MQDEPRNDLSRNISTLTKNGDQSGQISRSDFGSKVAEDTPNY